MSRTRQQLLRKKQQAMNGNGQIKLRPVVRKVISVTSDGKPLGNKKIPSNQSIRNKIMTERVVLTKSVTVDTRNDVLDEPDETIKIGKIIYLELDDEKYFLEMSYNGIFKLDLTDVDRLESISEFKNVVVRDDNLSYFDKIIKFCEITKLPIKIHVSDPRNVDIIIKIVDRKNIKYVIHA